MTEETTTLTPEEVAQVQRDRALGDVKREVFAEGTVVKTISVATDGEQIGASIMGLCTAGPLGAVAAWGAIRMFAGKWTPWTIMGLVASGPLIFIQLVMIGLIAGAVDSAEFPVMETERIEEVRYEV